MITLRKGRALDAGAMGAILSEFVDETDWMPRLHTRAEDIAHAGALITRGGVTVAEGQGRVIGFAACHGLDLDALYVRGHARGQGVGAALLAHVQGQVPAVMLWTFQANACARAFYHEHGFEEVARSDGAGTDEGLPDVRYEWHAVPLREWA